MGAVKSEPQIIATTSRSLTIFAIGILLAAGLLIAWFWWDAAQDWQTFNSHLYGRLALPAATLMYLGMWPLLAKGAGQILEHRGRIIWVEDGHLIYYHPSHFKVRCRDIVSLTPDVSRYGHHEIAMSLRDGGKKILPAHNMSISRDEILEHLREICGLPEPPP